MISLYYDIDIISCDILLRRIIIYVNSSYLKYKCFNQSVLHKLSSIFAHYNPLHKVMTFDICALFVDK